ncbi:MAG: dihydropteroate synthase [Pseudomonadota bacterium]|nr:dihydropteroate synthase [Pseudomonadota bacterium]
MNPLNFKTWLQNFKGSSSSPLVMGIMNITPDSFFSSSRHQSINTVLKAAEKMIDEGVDIIDIGAESTRPGSIPIDVETELKRVIPVITALRHHFDICLSIDTYKPMVMQAAIEVGANVINDVTGLDNQQSIEIIKKYDIPVCMMHISGTLADMSEPFQKQDNVIKKIMQFYNDRLIDLKKQNFPMKNLILDPGIGFGKQCADNLKIIHDIQSLCDLNFPVLLGVSRKRFIGEVLDKPIDERLLGSLSAQVVGFCNGCRIFRTHDVSATRETLQIAEAIKNSYKGSI